MDSGHGSLARDTVCRSAVEPDSIQPCLNPARQLTAVAIVDSVLVALRECLCACNAVHVERSTLAVENLLELDCRVVLSGVVPVKIVRNAARSASAYCLIAIPFRACAHVNVNRGVGTVDVANASKTDILRLAGNFLSADNACLLYTSDAADE